MFLTPHTAIAIAFSTAAGLSPPAAFVVGVISHFIADLVPHGDERIGEWARRRDPARRFAFAAAIDGLFLSGLLVLICLRPGFSWTAAAAAAGAILPDVLWGADFVLKREFIPGYFRFHQRLHNPLSVRLPLWAGLLLQAAVVAVCLFILRAL